MSDPAKTDDIEDVLSSIRRLVAENAKAAHDKDALVLTQSHRVKTSLAPGPVDQTVPLSSEPPLKGAERAEPSLTRSSVTPSVSPIVADRSAPPASATIPPAPVVTAAPQAPVAPIPQMTETAKPDTTFQTVRPRETAAAPSVADTTAAPEPNQIQPAPAEPARAIPPAPPMSASAETVITDPGLEDAIVEAAETALTEATISDIETQIASDGDDWETDDVFVTENDPSPTAPMSAPLVNQMDKAALKSMVSDLLREELRGEMGERITRNVRKLVRREIQRALTAQRLD